MENGAAIGATVGLEERNNIITARKYAIDVQYSEYEAGVIHEAELTDFAAKAASIGLTQTASLIPVAHTARMLTQIATGVDSLDSAYNEKVLRAQLIQNILASMRIARYNQAAVIYANMKCNTTQYPLPMALSDLELYYRAGTVPTGLVKLTQTIAKAENIAQANQDNQKPANAQGNAVLQGNATEAKAKADSRSNTSCENGPVPGQEFMRLNAIIKNLSVTQQKLLNQNEELKKLIPAAPKSPPAAK